ncbi:MAG: energy transducer TonB [Acidobacteriota bacterium]|nr:energy transducer TonB [Acidobacteriota bacterium]
MSAPDPKIPVKTPAGQEQHDILPTLFGDGYGLYEVRKGSFVASFVLNIAILGLLVWLATWTVKNVPQIKVAVTGEAVDVSPYIMKQSKTQVGGGGGGGSHDVNPASKGALPKLSKEQITPPAVLPPDNAKLQVAPTVVVPPQIKLPQGNQMGDPLAKVLGPPSNGTGVGGGIGSGKGGGVGSGTGPGVGPGRGGGIGGGVYHIGGGVSPPRIIHRVEPEFSDEARRSKYQGTVTLHVIIGTDGKPHDITVVQSLGMGLDEKAIEAALQWRFEPGTKDGRPVNVEANMQVTFHLY